MLNVIMLSVIRLSVVASKQDQDFELESQDLSTKFSSSGFQIRRDKR